MHDQKNIYDVANRRKTMSSRLVSKNLKVKIYKTIILPVVLYGCETWSHIKGGMQAKDI